MQVVLGHYPMTIAQLHAWARQQSALNPAQCERDLEKLDYPPSIAIRKA